jgi:hypothetical protein
VKGERKMSTKVVRPCSILLIAVLVLSAVTIAAPVVAAGPTVAVNPSTQTFGPAPCVGTHFTINVSISDVTNLYGFDIQIKWNTTWIRHVGHQKMIPVETHPGGVLHNPTVPLKDDVNETASMPGSEPGTMYWLAEASISPAPPFAGNGLAFVMEFVIVNQPSAEELDVTTWICFTYVSLLDCPAYMEIPGVSLTDGAVTILAAGPPTQADIETAIVDGVAWLANQQESDGSWPDYEYAGINFRDLGVTGLAVLKLEERAYEQGYDSPFDLSYAYHDNVVLGLDYLFSKLVITGITLQNHQTGATGTVDNPDCNGNGLGIYADGNCEKKANFVYDTGIALAAISASCTPLRLAANGKTYLAIAQDMVDWLAWAQSDKDYPAYSMGEGGWAYGAVDNASSKDVDNSIGGYATMGLVYATRARFGCGLPVWVKTELSAFIHDIQDPVTGDPNDGGSWYTHPNDSTGVNILKTGNLIFEMKLVGDMPTTPRVVNALNYLKRHWDHASGPPETPRDGWDGKPAEYQTMFCAMKGLSYMGINTFDAIDWYADFSTRIVEQQCKVPGASYGSWIATSYLGNPTLITEWALLTLEKIFSPPIMHLDAEPPVLIDRVNPVGTAWHELYPCYCNWHYLAGWFDSNNNSILDHCDHIILDNETGYSGWYHVENATVTLCLTRPDLNETMYVEFDGSIQDFPFNDSENTMWHEVYPEYGNWFNLTNWTDTDLTGNLTSSDQIRLGNATDWHVDAVKTDLLVTFEKHPDFGDAPDYWSHNGASYSWMYPSKLFSSLLWDGAVPPNIVSYWPFQEESGTIAHDSSGNNHDGTLTNGPVWMPAGAGPGLGFGHALSFDGYDDYVDVPHGSSLDVGAGDFSVQAWIKPSSVSSFRTIVDKRTGPPERGYAVFIWNGRLGLQLAEGALGYTNYYAPMSIAVDGLWHFVFVSVDRDKCATFCVDGEEISIPIERQGTLDDPNPNPLWIGGNHLHSSFYFAGGIDEVAIYDRALTSREVRQLRRFQVRDGASHVDWNYEWLGKSVNGEIDSKQVDKDEFDDGVEAAFVDVGGAVFLRLEINISTSGQPGRYDINDSDKVMYLNAWIDWNADGDWADNDEKIVGTGSATAYQTQAFAGPQTVSYSVLDLRAAFYGDPWLRVRLDYGEDVGANPQPWTDPSLDQYEGQAMFGEVEDYMLNRAVAVTDVIPSKYVTCQGYSGKINVTAVNYGGCTETFNVTVYANATVIGTQTVTNLPPCAAQTFSLNWNTIGFAKGSYAISAYAMPLPYENDTSDNIKFADGWSKVTILGDVDGDFTVTILDVVKITGIYASKPGDPGFNPNSDINNDGHITILDVVLCTGHYGQKWP